MKEFEEISAQQLDGLVDGELSESERRDVLLAADREPEAWRRLALAFVESQTLRGELTAWMKSMPTETTRAARVSSGTAARRGWLRMVGLVACSLLAFGLGRWSSLADQTNSMSQGPRTIANNNGTAGPVADVSPESVERHQTMRLVLDDLLGGPPQAVDVAVVDDYEGDPEDFLNGPPAISPEIQRALLRAGRRVHEQRQLFEVPLSDGRYGVVPVSNVLVENAGLDVYQ